MPLDHYSILGVPQDASPQDIKRAFRQIARECHPDVAGEDPEKEERFKQARKAYETLMDPDSRGRYDRRGQRRSPGGGSFFDAFYQRTGEQAGPDAERRTPRPASTMGSHDTGGARSNRRHDPRNDIGLDDLFNDFGDFGFGGTRRPPPKPASPDPDPFQPERGHDVEITLDVPAGVARDGGSVAAVYHRQQRADAWRPGTSDRGVVRIQDIADIRVVPGTRDGSLLREKGLGDAGAWGGPYGDLVVRVRVVGVADAAVRHDAPPVEQSVDITVVEALLGGRIEVETAGGKVRVTIPPGTDSGAKLRLKGKGPAGADGRPGDLFVVLRIVVPKRLDDESRGLIERFASLNPWDPRG